MSLVCNEGCKDLDNIMMTCRQRYVVAKVEWSWKNNSHIKKRMRKDDLLAIKLMNTMQVSFPITLACHFLEEEEDKRSLRSITTEI